ncbi:MAG TPA: riboflavin synthase [Myxococcota bacterium]|nr:riboflavin synthase [Myxococcota bacterium]
MFTGLVEAVGTVTQATGSSPRRITIHSAYDAAEVDIGASIAIDGCCLTVVEKAALGLTFEAATETLKRTTIGHLKEGSRVNLERSLKLGDRLDGHLVLGHVDGLGTIRERKQVDSAWYVAIEAPPDLAPLIATRGSVTIAGVSLTVVDVQGAVFQVGLIPHTWEVTTLADYVVGAPINLEADVMARYVQRLLDTRR